MPRCSSCGAHVEWVLTKAGKNMPLDPLYYDMIESFDGETVLVTDDGRTIRGELASPMLPTDGIPLGVSRGRKSHFASCPNAAMHRKEKR